MTAVLENKRADLVRLCERHRVRRLSVFGSAATDSFVPGRSDVDLLVEFEEMSPTDHANHFFGLQEDLEALLGVRVDLVEPRPIRNPYLRDSIEAGKVLIFETA